MQNNPVKIKKCIRIFSFSWEWGNFAGGRYNSTHSVLSVKIQYGASAIHFMTSTSPYLVPRPVHTSPYFIMHQRAT